MRATNLTREQHAAAYRALARWRQAPGEMQPCPVCTSRTLTIEDRSARPHAEWYYLNCASCGLDLTLNIPLAPPTGS